MSGSVPTPVPVDPWLDVYLPARLGERARALAALERASEVGGGAALDAVGARALAVLGDAAGAEVRARRAFAAGGEEAAALAVWFGTARRERARWRVERCRSPGLAADAGCDLAALALEEGDAAEARSAILAARGACPDHAEAGRWRRMLREADDPVALWRTARAPTRRLRRDRVELRPTAALGWVAPERFRRRVLGRGGGPMASPRTGLGRLQHAGVGGTWFGLPPEQRRWPAEHPRVELELAADRLIALVDEGRDATLAALALRDAAGEAELDAARVLVHAASGDDHLAALGVAAARRLAEAEPWPPGRWAAWGALLLRGVDPTGAAAEARRLLALPGLDRHAWRVALDTLRLVGAGEEARERARRDARPERHRERDAFLAALAATPPPRPGSVGRLRPAER